LGEVTSKVGMKKGKKQRSDAGPDAMLLHHYIRSRLPLAHPVKLRTILKDL
jgi:hypothetical protein